MNAAAGGPAGFPWAEAMAAGFALLRLSPNAFWTMTPRELAAAMGWLARSRPEAPGRSEIEEMMRIFPDRMNTRSGYER